MSNPARDDCSVNKPIIQRPRIVIVIDAPVPETRFPAGFAEYDDA
jgi:hypothetical protein